MSSRSYYLISYHVRKVGPTGPIRRFANAVIDEDPAEWLHKMLIRHESEHFVLVNSHRLTPEQFERMATRINDRSRTRSLPRPTRDDLRSS